MNFNLLEIDIDWIDEWKYIAARTLRYNNRSLFSLEIEIDKVEEKDKILLVLSGCLLFIKWCRVFRWSR